MSALFPSRKTDIDYPQISFAIARKRGLGTLFVCVRAHIRDVTDITVNGGKGAHKCHMKEADSWREEFAAIRLTVIRPGGNRDMDIDIDIRR